MLRWTALAAYVGLLALVFAWEAWAAPATPVPRAFWIGLKTLPLAVPLPWLLRGSARAHVLAALLLLLYFCEGVAVGYHAAKTGELHALAYAAVEIAASVIFIVTAALYARVSSPGARSRAGEGTES